MIEGPIIERRRPCIVNQRDRARRLRRFHDDGHIDHFKQLRSRRLQKNRPRVRPKLRSNVTALFRTEIRHIDAEPLKDRIKKFPRGAVNAIGGKQMVAGAEKSRSSQRVRRCAGRCDQRRSRIF